MQRSAGLLFDEQDFLIVFEAQCNLPPRQPASRMVGYCLQAVAKKSNSGRTGLVHKIKEPQKAVTFHGFLGSEGPKFAVAGE
jgi:hypothetical protein